DEDVAALVDSASSCRSPPPVPRRITSTEIAATSATPPTIAGAHQRERVPARVDSARSPVAFRSVVLDALRFGAGCGSSMVAPDGLVDGSSSVATRGRSVDGGRDALDDDAPPLSVGAFDSGDPLVGRSM